MEEFILNFLVYSIFAVIIGIPIILLLYGTGFIIRYLLPILLFPFMLPFAFYLSCETPRIKTDNLSGWDMLKKMFIFYGRLLTWRRPFLP
jgi:hypothetical protein